ncbi:MAG: hypothetical protein Q4A82_06105 [Corynebacterium sp.]|nr:hypothetical protein [Corynebacterium sp.]
MNSMFRYQLQAELVRLKNSASVWFSCVDLVFGVLTIVLSAEARTAGFESASFSWQVIYFTGLAGPLMMVLAALSEIRDRMARNGGVQWRGLDMRMVQLARLFGVVLVSAMFQICSFGSVVLFAEALLAKAVVGAGFSWVGSLGILGVGALLARRFGLVGALVGGVVWQIVGMGCVESWWWFLCPPAWSIRILLDPIGVNANGTPISPDNPVLAEPEVYGLVLCAALGVGMFALVSTTATWLETTPPQSIHARQVTGTNVDSFAIGEAVGVDKRQPVAYPLRSIMLTQRGAGVIPLILVTLGVLAGLAVVYGAGLAAELFTFFVFRLGWVCCRC